MSQSNALIQTLKQVLRRQGKTYKDVAVALGLSEASVKRLFAEKSFSLERFEKVCEFAEMEFAELVRQMEKTQALITHLSHEQEKELVGDVKLLLITVLLLSHWQFDEILETYDISELDGIRLMARLDRMKIITLQPGNRVKLIVDRSFNWLPNGPIQRFFEAHVQSDFFASHFTGPGELRLVVNGMLSRQSNSEMQKKMQRLAQEFNQLHSEDEQLPGGDRFGTSMVVAMRPWELKIFNTLRREGKEKVF